jgi:hypothetical protein
MADSALLLRSPLRAKGPRYPSLGQSGVPGQLAGWGGTAQDSLPRENQAGCKPAPRLRYPPLSNLL